jgi:HEAT repeat protein
MTISAVSRFLRTGSLAALLLCLSLLGRVRTTLLTVEKVRKMQLERDTRGLVDALGSSDPDIQYEAVEALGEIRDPATVEALAALFSGEGYSGVRWKVAEALSKIGEPAVSSLIAALSHADDDVRWKAAIALGEIKDARAVDPLVRLLSDPDRFVKSRAALALGSIGAPAVDPLIRALREGDGNQRWGAAIALGKIKDERAVGPLIHALADKYENVRAESATALAAIGDPAVAPLIRFLKFADSRARIEVMNTLADLEAADAVEPLIQMLEGADENERRAIAAVLDDILTPAIEPVAKRIWNGEANGNTEHQDGNK